jgi:hypothetical protein
MSPERSVHQCECAICQAGSDPVIRQRHAHMNLFLSRLTEPQRRWYVGLLSQESDSPSDRELALISGLDKNTIQRGRHELEAGLADLPAVRQRRAGAGRPAAEKKTRNSKPRS